MAIYVPREDVRIDCLREAKGTTVCEWKGTASYFDAIVGDHVRPRAAWTYPDPKPAFEAIRDHLAFYAGRVDACWLDDERVTPPPGLFRRNAGRFGPTVGTYGLGPTARVLQQTAFRGTRRSTARCVLLRARRVPLGTHRLPVGTQSAR